MTDLQFTPEEERMTAGMPINIAMGVVAAHRKRVIADMVAGAQIPESEIREAFETLAERMRSDPVD
jgi:hypothetical protein